MTIDAPSVPAARRAASVQELLEALQGQRTRLPAEVGGFIALEACDLLLERPVCLESKDLFVLEDGSLAIASGLAAASSGAAAAALASLLATLLVAAGPEVSKQLLQLVERAMAEPGWDLATLRQGLDAALVPLNREAAQRVLTRFVRLTQRYAGLDVATPLSSPDAAGHLDAALDALLSGQRVSANHTASASETLAPAQTPPQATPGQNEPAAVAPPAPDALRTPSIPVTAAAGRPSTEPTTLERPSRRKLTPAPAVADPTAAAVHAWQTQGQSHSQPPTLAPPPKRWRWWAVAAAVTLSALFAAVTVLRPQLWSPSSPQTSPRKAADAVAPRGELSLHVSPPSAQVLLFVGHAPVRITRAPMDSPHEFVAVGPKLVPSRAIVPVGAHWPKGPDGPLFELALQLHPSHDAQDRQALGPALLDALTGSRAKHFGTIRVLTTPAAQAVYQLVGFAPEVRIRGLATDRPQRLLIYAPDHPWERLVIDPGAWQQTKGKDALWHYEVDVQLAPRQKAATAAP